MDDTISRQAVIDALEKVAELYPWRVPGDRDSYSSYNEAWQDALNRVENEIEALPTAQPEIIRCKDCRFQDKGSNESESWNLCGYRPWLHVPTEDEHYCGYAEGRTDE